MTMPQERTRALRWGWEFLVELRASDYGTYGRCSALADRNYSGDRSFGQWQAFGTNGCQSRPKHGDQTGTVTGGK